MTLYFIEIFTINDLVTNIQKKCIEADNNEVNKKFNNNEINDKDSAKNYDKINNDDIINNKVSIIDEFIINENIKVKDINKDENEENSKIDEINVEIILSEDKKEILKFNIYEDIYSKIKNFCEQNNLRKTIKNLIIKEIIQKIGERIDNIENENNNYDVINIKQRKSIATNKSFDTFNCLRKSKIKNFYINEKKYHKSFEKNIILKKNKNEKNNILSKSNSEISKDMAFQPKINKKSKEIAKNLNKNIKIEDRLISFDKERERRLLKKMVENSFIENNKFDINNIDSNKKYIYNHKQNKRELTRNKSEDIFNKLYKAGNKNLDIKYKIKEDKFFKD